MNLSPMNDCQNYLLGFDPGRDKCGLAVMDEQGTVYDHGVIPSGEAIAQIEQYRRKYPITQIIMGNQTTAKIWKQQLIEALSPPLPIVLVDERNSSLEARDRYWEMYPPQGLTRLIPQGMRVPPRPIDDIVAILLIERYFRSVEHPSSG
ncbi:pre-16S rRNA-processing nuclease YqgF [Spirulina subsalsa FACHB-351]|uniref:Pre-16S rRNA-processing nuclease YqgF n=1 Tax=Spirulina subsalsa FACHB-351 TaxID=234711 RepID=A0ABT3LAD1_9CYAN|nr:pre-16S rRNA-processing nuclease YqgF [Spirulina subsalsa FACHB-351]